MPKTWQQVQAVTKFLKGKQVGGFDAYGHPTPKGLGRFRLLFPRQPRHRLRQAPGRSGLAVRRRHDEATRQQPGLGARDPGRARRHRRSAADQLNADPGTTGFQQFLAGTGSMLSWWGDIGSNAKTSDSSVIGDVCGFDILPGSDDVYNHGPASGTPCRTARTTRPTWRTSAGASTSWRGSTAIRSSRRRPGAPRAHLGKDISLWCAAYPSGFQPYRNSHFNIPEWVAAGYDEAFISSYSRPSPTYNHPNAAIEPRIPGIFQYYSVAEDELAKIYAGQFDAQTGADNIAAAWERITDQIGRETADRALQGVARRLAPPNPARGWRDVAAGHVIRPGVPSKMGASATGRRPTAHRRGG